METQRKANWHGPKQVWIMIYTAILFLIGSCIIGGNNNTVFPALAEMRGWDVNALHIVSGFGCILKGLGILIFARITTRFGPKNIIVITLFITAALVVVFGNTSSLPVMLIVILALGLLGGAYEKNGGMKVTANWWPTKKGVVLGFTTMGIIGMNFLYVPVMPKLFGAVGISMGMNIVAIIIAVIALLAVFFVKSTPEEAGAFPDGNPDYAVEGASIEHQMREYKSPFTFKKICSDPYTWTMGIGSGLAFLAVMTFIASLIPTLLSYGYTMTLSATVFAVGGFMGLFGSFLFGLIDQKIGTKKAFVIYFFVIIIGFICTLFMDKNVLFVWAASIIVFGAQGALCNLLPSFVATRYGRWDYLAGYQVIGTTFEIGAGVGIMAIGFFARAQSMYIFDIAILIIGCILIALTKSSFIGKADKMKASS